MKPQRGRQKAAGGSEMDAVAARKTLSDSSGARSWLASLLGGVLSTFFVFVFLGYLQPTMSSSEAISLPDIVQLQTGLGADRKPPPPPQRETQKKAERKPPPKRVQKVARETVDRSKPTRTQQSVRQLNSLASMNLDIGIGPGGGGPALPISLDMGAEEYEREAREVEEYLQTRDRVRQQSYERSRGGGMSSLGGGVTEPRLIFRPAPVYPTKARQEQVEGFIIIKVLISADGSITEFEILGGRPEGVFDDAVIDSLSRWRFSPAKDSGGRPIEFWKDYKIEFELEE